MRELLYEFSISSRQAGAEVRDRWRGLNLNRHVVSRRRLLMLLPEGDGNGSRRCVTERICTGFDGRVGDPKDAVDATL